MFDVKTIVAVLSYLAITGLLNLAIGHRSQIDAWAESKPRLAALLKLLRGFGFDPWLLVQALSLAVSKRLPAAIKSTPEPLPEKSSIGKLPPLAVFALTALLVISCSSGHPMAAADASPLEAAVVILKSEIADFDDMGATGVNYFPSCNGIAVGAKRILTARHCLVEDPLYFVDAETWDTTSSGKSLASVDGGVGAIASITPRVALTAWLPRVAAAHDGPAFLVHLRGTAITEEQTNLSGTHVDAADLDHGDSGSAVIQDGAVVGIVELCDATDGQTCLGTGGTFTRAVML